MECSRVPPAHAVDYTTSAVHQAVGSYFHPKRYPTLADVGLPRILHFLSRTPLILISSN